MDHLVDHLLSKVELAVSVPAAAMLLLLLRLLVFVPMPTILLVFVCRIMVPPALAKGTA
jgi:hypothetical protein